MNPLPDETAQSSSSPAPLVSGDVPTLHLRLPWNSFYWSLIDVSDIPERTRRSTLSAARATLDDLFQSELPLPVEELATAYSTATGNTVLACALPLPTLNAALANHPALLTLTPADLPPALCARCSSGNLEFLNILVGAREPIAIQTLRGRTRHVTAALVAAALVLASFGVLRRAFDGTNQAAVMAAAIRQSLSEVSGADRDTATSIRQLENERDRLILTRTAQAARGLPTDASHSIQSVLAAWPRDLEMRTQAIAVTEQGVKLAVEVNDQGGAETLTKALGTLADWTLQSQRTHASGPHVRFDATLQPKGSHR